MAMRINIIFFIIGILLLPIFLTTTYILWIAYALSQAPFIGGAEFNYLLILYELILFFIAVLMPIFCWKNIRNIKSKKQKL